MRPIDSLRQLQALIGDTYMYAVIVALVAVVIAYLVANLIKWGGGKFDTSHVKRRVWYIIIGIITLIAFYLYNTLYVGGFITRAPLLAKFKTANLFATLCILGVYVALGIVTMLLLRRSKWGSILGKSK